MKSDADAPNFLEMVRANNSNVTEADAKAYALSLPQERRQAPSGCYCIKCMRPCQFPIGCSYNNSCNWCLWVGCSTIPFGCCIILSGSKEKGYYVNPKGDTVVVKVDDENGTLACFAHNCGNVCCYCNKI
mmetsp:Transcript_30410/g.40151  ORF Transcript_30410/g.40151 Transcript_30410/m.40151 type:complete len:130 (+) Transcript_30410:238-627(+)